MKTTASSELLAPAFRNKWELIVFLLFVVFVLSFPFIPKEGWIDRGKLYLNIPDSSSHGFEYFAKTIWNHPGDIDVLLVGNSALGSGFRPDLLKKKLAHLTGEREPVVFLTDHNGDHIEIEYMQIKDLLARKKIKLLIWNLNSDAARYDDRHADGLWDFYTHHEFLSTLDAEEKTDLYWKSVFATLKNLNAHFRPLKYAVSIGCQEYYLAEDASKLKNHCSMAERHYGARSWSYKNRMGLSPLATVPVHNAVHWRSRSRNKIKYSPKLPASQQHMRNLIVKEARKHGTAVAFINMPYALFAKPMNKIVVPTMKKSDIAYHVPILSLNRKKLFPKLSNKEVAAYYARKNREKLHHFHMSGAIYFTNMITPSIVGLYKKLVLDEQRGADK